MNMRNKEAPDDAEINTQPRNLSRIYIELPTTLQFSEEKLKNWLYRNIKKFESRHSWKIPLAILLPLIFTLVTSSFKGAFGIEADVWMVLCILIIIGVSIWLIILLIKLPKLKSPDDLVAELKKELVVKIQPSSIEKEKASTSKHEYSKIRNKEEFITLIRDAIYHCHFPHYESNSSLFGRNYGYEINDREKKYFIIIDFWPLEKGGGFPSEQVEKYFDEVEKSEIPYLVTTNAPKLTQKAQTILDSFNNKFSKPKLFIILGSTKDDFTTEIKNKIEVLGKKDSNYTPFITISFIENENKFILRNTGNSPALKVKIEDVTIVEHDEYCLKYRFPEVDVVEPGQEKDVKIEIQENEIIINATLFDKGAIISHSAVSTHKLHIKYVNIENEQFFTTGKWGKGGIVINGTGFVF